MYDTVEIVICPLCKNEFAELECGDSCLECHEEFLNDTRTEYEE